MLRITLIANVWDEDRRAAVPPGDSPAKSGVLPAVLPNRWTTGCIPRAEAAGFAIKANEILTSIKNNENSKDVEVLKNRNQYIRNLKRSEQIKKINPYVFNVLIYKKD